MTGRRGAAGPRRSREPAGPANQPVFMHCAGTNRVSAFWMIHRVLDEGMSVEEAEKEAERVGTRSPALKEFARGYIERHQPPAK